MSISHRYGGTRERTVDCVAQQVELCCISGHSGTTYTVSIHKICYRDTITCQEIHRTLYNCRAGPGTVNHTSGDMRIRCSMGLNSITLGALSYKREPGYIRQYVDVCPRCCHRHTCPYTIREGSTSKTVSHGKWRCE